MAIPLYGFVAGDSLGVLVMVDDNDTIAEVAHRLQQAAQVRVPPRQRVQVSVNGKPLELDATVKEVGLVALDRVDVTPLGPEAR